MSAVAILHLREGGGVVCVRGRGVRMRGGGEVGGAHWGETPSIKLNRNYQPAARESQGFLVGEQEDFYFIFFWPFLSAKSQQAVEQRGQAADNQIRHLVFLLQTTAGTSLSPLYRCITGHSATAEPFFAPYLNFLQGKWKKGKWRKASGRVCSAAELINGDQYECIALQWWWMTPALLRLSSLWQELPLFCSFFS